MRTVRTTALAQLPMLETTRIADAAVSRDNDHFGGDIDVVVNAMVELGLNVAMPMCP